MSASRHLTLELAIRSIELDQNQFIRPHVYINWLEEARANYFASKGWSYPDLNQPGNLLYVMSLDMRYLIPVRMDITGGFVAIECWSMRTEGERLTFEYVIKHTQKNDLVFAKATTQMAFLNSEGREITMPDSWRTRRI